MYILSDSRGTYNEVYTADRPYLLAKYTLKMYATLDLSPTNSARL